METRWVHIRWSQGSFGISYMPRDHRIYNFLNELLLEDFQLWWQETTNIGTPTLFKCLNWSKCKNPIDSRRKNRDICFLSTPRWVKQKPVTKKVPISQNESGKCALKQQQKKFCLLKWAIRGIDVHRLWSTNLWFSFNGLQPTNQMSRAIVYRRWYQTFTQSAQSWLIHVLHADLA